MNIWRLDKGFLLLNQDMLRLDKKGELEIEKKEMSYDGMGGLFVFLNHWFRDINI